MREQFSKYEKHRRHAILSVHVVKLKFHQLKYLTHGNRVSLVHKQEYWIINTDGDALTVSTTQ